MNWKILLFAAAMLFADVALAQPPGGPSAKPPEPPAEASPHPRELPEGPGKAVVQTACAQCHSIDIVTHQSRSREEWTDVVSRMIGNGAQLGDDEYDLVIEYLTRYFGPSAPRASAGGSSGK